MSDLGFLYVLANSAMPGMVKVGKTTRTPTERAEELSGATGLPTPFIIVYEQLFENCSSAESFVHTYLAQRGFRVSPNREFFNAPTNEVVRAIALAPGAIVQSEIQQSDMSSQHSEERAQDVSPEPIWISTWEDAENHYYGLGDTFQDYRAAYRLYKQAVKLGCTAAYARLGYMSEFGEGTLQSVDDALEMYKLGANAGRAYCYWRIAVLYLNVGNLSNFEKALNRYEDSRSIDGAMSEDERFKSNLECIPIIYGSIISREELPLPMKKLLADARDGIVIVAQRGYDSAKRNNDFAQMDFFRCVFEYLLNPEDFPA